MFLLCLGGVRNGTENSEHENVNNWAAHQVRYAFIVLPLLLFEFDEVIYLRTINAIG